MLMDKNEISAKLSDKGLRVTPQRIAILEAIMRLNNHPSAEQIIEDVKANHPNISVGTVYKVLDSFVENSIVNKVKTTSGNMRFDPMLRKHHHLYCTETDRIEDYEDDELDKLISDYLIEKGISDFKIEDFKLQITGIFK